VPSPRRELLNLFLASNLLAPQFAHTSSVHSPMPVRFDNRSREKFREELALTVIRDLNPSLAALPLK
jgi:hypothetical protein